jgi:CHAT domain-containing protein
MVLALWMFAGSCGNGGDPAEPSMAALRSLLSQGRFLEPRLSLGATYTPCRISTQGFTVTCQTTSRPGRHELEQLLTAQRLAVQGRAERSLALVRLVAGQKATDLDAPIAMLELLAQDPGGNRPAALSDLSAAYLKRAELGGDSRDLLHALERAQAAIEESPDLAEAVFNRALALERLRLVRRAAFAWAHYREIDPGNGWAEEAEKRRARLAVLGSRRLRPAQSDFLEKLDSRPDRLRAAVARQPEMAVEAGLRRVLAEWASAVVAGDRAVARRHRDRLVRIGEILRREAGDPFLEDVAAHIASLSTVESVQLAKVWAEALATIDRYEDWHTAEAGRTFARLAPLLRKLGSPLALTALRYQAICAYQDHRPAAATALAGRLLADAKASGYVDMAGRAGWILGLLALEAVELDRARSHFEDARQRFSSIGASSLEAGVLSLLAGVSSYIGDPEEAWNARLAALDKAVKQGVSDRYPVIVGAAARDAAKLGFHRAAREFAEEAFAFDAENGEALNLAEAHWRRARIRRLGGASEEAAQDLEAAFELAEAIRPDSVQRHTRAGLLAERGLLLGESRPSEALTALDQALVLYGSEQFSLTRLELRTAQARALFSLGRKEEAEAGLERVVEEFTRQAASVENLAERVRLFDQMAPTLETLVDLRFQAKDRAGPTLVLTEKGRGRWLADLLGAPPPERVAQDVVAATREGGALVEYLPLESGTIWWLAAAGELRHGMLPVTSEELETLQARSREALAAGDLARFRRTNTKLYEALISPLSLPSGRLVVVPGTVLDDMPWAALVDPGSGSYLIESRDLLVAPSARVFVQAGRSLALAASLASARALVVGDPAFDRARFPALSRLPGAQEEAAAIARHVAGSVLFSGEDATPAAFKSGIDHFPIVHFAGHALAVQHPLYSELVFAPDQDGGRSTMRADEIYGLRLHRTQLVVLAACSSGVGYRSDLEGSLGLAHAFLAAGVPQVIAALWPLADGASRDFFSVFYESLRSSGQPAAALRNAQLAALRSGDRRLSNPRVWAAFQLVGTTRFDHFNTEREK